MLQRAQNRAMRVILHCNKCTKVDHTLHTLQFMSVKQRLHYAVCIFVYKTLNGMSPLSLRNQIEIVASESHMRTRQAGTIVLGFRKTRNARNEERIL